MLIVAFQPKPIAIPLEYFQAIPRTVAKRENRAAHRVKLETRLRDERQSVDLFAPVGRSTGQIHAFA
jgi:hypothetical protein